MYCRRGLPIVLVALLALACDAAPTATGGPTPTLDLDLLDTSGNTAGTSVEVKSEHLTGTLPNGGVVDINLKAGAQGTEPGSLTGDGRHFSSTGAHNYWPATGSTNGISITLSGAVTETNVAFLMASPVLVAADASTQVITLYFGPLSGGPFAGHTMVLTGTGKVTITTTP
jgi:hypothetical protein